MLVTTLSISSREQRRPKVSPSYETVAILFWSKIKLLLMGRIYRVQKNLAHIMLQISGWNIQNTQKAYCYQDMDHQAYERLLFRYPYPFLVSSSAASRLSLQIRFKHYFLAKYLLRLVDFISKFLKTLRQRASIEPNERCGKNIRPSSSQSMFCLKPTFKILSQRTDHLSDPPTFEDCRIILGYTTRFHLNFISSTLASRASERRCQLMIPDSITKSFNFLSSRSFQLLLQETDLSSGSSYASGSFFDRDGNSGSILRQRPVVSRTFFISAQYLIFPCQRLMMELMDRRFFMQLFTCYHLIPCFFTPSLRSWSSYGDHLARLLVMRQDYNRLERIRAFSGSDGSNLYPGQQYIISFFFPGKSYGPRSKSRH